METVADGQIDYVLEHNLQSLQQILGKSDDLVIRVIHYDGSHLKKAALVYIDGLVSDDKIDERILKTLMLNMQHSVQEGLSLTDAAQHVKQSVMPIGDIKETAEIR